MCTPEDIIQTCSDPPVATPLRSSHPTCRLPVPSRDGVPLWALRLSGTESLSWGWWEEVEFIGRYIVPGTCLNMFHESFSGYNNIHEHLMLSYAYYLLLYTVLIRNIQKVMTYF